jgi:hypothetical protein
VAYRAFLSSEPPKQEADLATENLHLCDGKEAQTIESAAPKAAAPAPRPPFYTDALGDTFAVAGVAALSVGGAFALVGNARASDVADARTYDDAFEAHDGAVRARMIAAVAGGVGAALVVVAVVRFLTRSDPTPRGRIEPVRF